MAAAPTVKVEQTVAVPASLFAADGFEVANRSDTKESVGRAVIGSAANMSEGRTTRGGKPDDSIGRTAQGGKPDDSIGRATQGGKPDDSIGRTTKTGKPDDSIGRTSKTGKPDDSIGGGDAASFDAVRDSLVGPDTDPARLALRDKVYGSIENPSYASGIPAGDARAVPLLKQKLTAFANTLPTADRSQLATLTGKLDESGLRLMGALVEQDPTLLSDTDTKGGTLLSNLTRMATQPLNANLAGDVKASDLLTSTLRDVVNPNRVDQGTATTCTVTSIQFELVADSPSEYARIMGDLSGPAGTSKMQGGGSLEMQAGDGSSAALDDRSITDSLFQTAAMEYANGKYANFDPVSGKSTDTRTGTTFEGIQPIQQSSLLEQLFGVKYSTKNMYSEAQGQTMLDSLQGFDAAEHPNRPVILQLDQGSINHAVTLEKVADGRVTFRDPYGVMRSMPQELFPKYVVGVNQPIQ